MTQYRRAAWERRSWKTLAVGEETRMYDMDFLAKGGPQSFLVEGCPVKAATSTAMQVHFLHWGVLDTVVVLEEVNLLLIR